MPQRSWKRRHCLAIPAVVVAAAVLASCAGGVTLPNQEALLQPFKSLPSTDQLVSQVKKLIPGDDATRQREAQATLVRQIKDSAAMQQALASGALQASARDATGRPLLVLAIDEKAPESFRVLLMREADANAADAKGRTAWMVAVLSESPIYLEQLQAQRGRPSATLPESSILAMAQQLSDKGLFKPRLPYLLLWASKDEEASVRTELLRMAAKAGDSALTVWLVNTGVHAHRLEFDDLQPFLQRGQERVLEQLLQGGARADSTSTSGQGLLYAAVESQNAEAVAVLLQKPGAVQAIREPWDPVKLALYKGMTGVAVALVTAGANPDLIHRGTSAVDAAQAMVDVEFLRFLNRVPPKPTAETAELVKDWLPAASGVKFSGDPRTWSPADTEALRDYQKSASLPAHGHPTGSLLAGLEAARTQAFLRAVEEGRSADVRRMLAQSPSLMQVRDAQGFDALMVAAAQSNLSVATVLLDAKMPVDRLSANGSNALLIAALSQKGTLGDRLHIVKALVAAGASPDVKNSDNVSARLVAEAAGGMLATAMGISADEAPTHLFVAVLSRPAPTGTDTYKCGGAGWREWMQERWKSARITSVLQVGDMMCMVSGQTVLGGAAQSVDQFTQGELSAKFDERKAKGYTLSDAAYEKDRWTALWTDGRGAIDGLARSDDATNLRSFIKERVWDREFTITRIVPAGTSWLVIYGNVMGYHSQAWTGGRLDKVIADIQRYWKEGRAVTSLASDGKTWVAVLSKGAGVKDQTLVVAKSVADLNRQVGQMASKGWGVTLLAGEPYSAERLAAN